MASIRAVVLLVPKKNVRGGAKGFLPPVDGNLNTKQKYRDHMSS